MSKSLNLRDIEDYDFDDKTRSERTNKTGAKVLLTIGGIGLAGVLARTIAQVSKNKTVLPSSLFGIPVNKVFGFGPQVVKKITSFGVTIHGK